jgi:hypothetical protein
LRFPAAIPPRIEALASAGVTGRSALKWTLAASCSAASTVPSSGKDSRHVDPRVIGSWRHPIDVEPPVTAAGKRDFRPLTALLEQPLAIRDASRRPRQAVWHCVLRAAPDDRNLTDDQWREIVRELMHRLGLSERGKEGEGVRWVVVAHGDNHVHVVAVMARQDGRRAHVDREYIRVGRAVRWAERTYKLHVTGHTDGTADKRPTRDEQEKARRAGRRQPPRVTLRRKVQAAAAAAGTEGDFFAGLEARGVQVRLRNSTVNPGEVTGYAVGLSRRRQRAAARFGTAAASSPPT